MKPLRGRGLPRWRPPPQGQRRPGFRLLIPGSLPVPQVSRVGRGQAAGEGREMGTRASPGKGPVAEDVRGVAPREDRTGL